MATMKKQRGQALWQVKLEPGERCVVQVNGHNVWVYARNTGLNNKQPMIAVLPDKGYGVTEYDHADDHFMLEIHEVKSSGN